MTRRLLASILVAAAAGVCVAAAGARPAAPRLVLPTPPTSFGRMADVPLLPASARYAGPATPHSLAGVRMAAVVRQALARAGAAGLLARNGFVVLPADLRLFHTAYEGNVYDGWPVFVTTDVAYHELHLVFDKTLRTLEEQVLLPKLERLLTGLLRAAHAQAVVAAGSPIAGAAARVEQLYEVAAAELGMPVSLGPLARREKALVDAHDSAGSISPLTGVKTDYSLFAPRGHYTRTPALRRYFVAMSVLGQERLCLPGTSDCDTPDPARLGILASRVLTSSQNLVRLWGSIYEPTAFLVGGTDDYTPLEAARAATTVAAGEKDPAVFADADAVRSVAAALAKARPVLIDPDRASIRLMPTRFTLDSFVLDQLLSPNVGSADRQRLVPSGLDVAAAFGSALAYDGLRASGATAYARYDSQLGALRSAIAARPVAQWGATVYDGWLHALQPMFLAHGQAFPDFMRTPAWAAKAQQTGLGSYAELKHDTLLYSKQVLAEGGDNEQIPPRRNWVEPDPVAFGRIAAVEDLLREGLARRGLLTPAAGALLRDESALVRFFARIARDELAGRPIARRDNDRLTYIGGELEGLYWRTAERYAAGGAEADQDDAVVADVSTSAKGILEVATGRIDRIYVLVPDDGGRFQVAVGGVYAYYELTSPPGTRLTDEVWRARLDGGWAPSRPSWERAFLAG